MKLLVLSVCLIATAMVAHAGTIKDAALHGESLSNADLEECYHNANVEEADLITNTEIKDGSYQNPENEERTRKSGCFVSCILQKRGLIVGSDIQKEKLYGKEAHAFLNPGTQAKIYKAVDTCVEQVKTKSDECDKSFSLLTCLWKDFI